MKLNFYINSEIQEFRLMKCVKEKKYQNEKKTIDQNNFWPIYRCIVSKTFYFMQNLQTTELLLF